MATGYIAARANANVDADIAAFPWVQLHTGAPGAAGTANVAGNATRKDVSASFAPASAGSATSDVDITWTDAEVDTAETYSFCSFWSASTAGTAGFTGTVTSAAVSATGDAFSILSGGLSVTLAVAA